ncbi:hypothetical protein Bca4012_020559 [Brassica carinata]
MSGGLGLLSSPLVLLVYEVQAGKDEGGKCEAPAFAVVLNFLLPLAVPLFLFRADLRRVVQSTGKLLLAFLIGSTVATTVGTALAYYLVPMRALGPDSWKISAALMGRHIGGSTFCDSTLFVCFWFQMDGKNNLTCDGPEEIPSPKFTDCLKSSSTPWGSPICHGSGMMMPSTPLAWRFDSAESTLK